jgi:hypothetical protein
VSLPAVASLYLVNAAEKVSLNPDLGGLPGGPAAQKLLNGAAAFALMACVGIVILGAAQWGLGSQNGNYAHASDGKMRMLKGVGGAFAVGAAAAVINFFFGAGSTVH